MKYFIPAYGETWADAHNLPYELYASQSLDPPNFAEQAAEYVNDYLEPVDWPSTIGVVDESGVVSMFTIKMQTRYDFLATPLKASNE